MVVAVNTIVYLKILVCEFLNKIYLEMYLQNVIAFSLEKIKIFKNKRQ